MGSKSRNIYWIIAGVLCSLTTLLHIIGGQIDLVSPLMESQLSMQAKTEWLGAWHIVSAVLLVSSFYLLKYGYNSQKTQNLDTIQMIGLMFILFGVVFIVSSLVMQTFAPQWIILLSIGVLTLIGDRKHA